MRSALALLSMLVPMLCAMGQGTAGLDPLEPARREFQRGNLDAALAALDLAKDETRNARLLDLRGCIYLEQQKFGEAAAAFRAAQESDSALFLPKLHAADVLLRQSKWAEAREAYQTLIKQTNILMFNERLRYAIFITHLGGKDDAGARDALARITFPTETPAYYYAQAAWAFAHGTKRSGDKWLRTADEIFDNKATAWFGRPLHDLGWLKEKPPFFVESL